MPIDLNAVRLSNTIIQFFFKILILTFSLRLDASFQTLFLTCHSHVQRHHPHTFDFPFISLSPSSSNHPPLVFFTSLARFSVAKPSSPHRHRHGQSQALVSPLHGIPQVRLLRLRLREGPPFPRHHRQAPTRRMEMHALHHRYSLFLSRSRVLLMCFF